METIKGSFNIVTALLVTALLVTALLSGHCSTDHSCFTDHCPTCHSVSVVMLSLSVVFPLALLLVFQRQCYVSALRSQIGYIVHKPSEKLIHPLGGSSNPSDNTRLVIYRGGLGESRLQLQFEEDPTQEGYGYIKHVPSGKYVHPLGRSLQPGDNTPLVFHRGKHAACLFIFDVSNDYIIHKGSKKIWHPKGGLSNPADNTVSVLHQDRHNRAKFFFASECGTKVFNILVAVGYILHRASGKLVHPYGGSANPADNTKLVFYAGGLGERRLQLHFESDCKYPGYAYIRHLASGKYVHPLGGSLQPGNDTPLVFHSGKHAACLFLYDSINSFMVQKSSNKVWHPRGGSANPPDNTEVVLHSDRHDRAKVILLQRCLDYN